MTSRYTLPELAERAGMTLEEVHDLIKAGVLEPTLDQTVPTTALNRVRLAHALAQDIPLETSPARSSRFVDGLFANPVPLEQITYGEMAEELDLQFEDLAQLFSTWELPAPSRDQWLRRDYVQMLDALRLLSRQGIDAASFLRNTRFFGKNLRRLADHRCARSSQRSSSPCGLRGRPFSRCLRELRR